MRLGMIGLGRMGANMARRLCRAGIEVVGYDRQTEIAESLARETGLVSSTSIEELVAHMTPPRAVWMMLPAGEITESSIDSLQALMTPGDTLIDGGNAHYRDTVRRSGSLADRGIHFIDVGVSGGIWGLERGYALMIGGPAEAVAGLQPVISALAPSPDRGWIHTGPAGSGHFVKMIHNGIEYGMMQAYAEGFALLRDRDDWNLDLAGIARSWQHGSVIESWLLERTADVLAQDQQLADVAPVVADSGEGRWTVTEAVERGIPAPVISAALNARFVSRDTGSYAARLLAMMRLSFGGHKVLRAGERDDVDATRGKG